MATPRFDTNPVPPHRKAVAVDTETFLIAPGRLAPQLVCVTICDENGQTALFDHEDGLNQFRDLIRDDDKLLVFANAPFDLGVFCAQDAELIPWVFRAYEMERIADVQTWDKLWNIRKGYTMFDPALGGKPPTYSLEACVQRWLKESVEGKKGEDAWRYRYAELFNVDLLMWPEEAKRYALKDAEYTLRVWKKQVEQAGIIDDFWRQCKYHWALHLFSCRGLRTQEEVVREVESDINRHVDEVVGHLLNNGFYRIGGTKKEPKLQLNSQLVKDRVAASFARRGEVVPLTPVTEKGGGGNVKTDSETLESCTDDPELLMLAEVSNDKKLQSTYLPVLLQGIAFPINPGYNVLVDSGRTSSHNPNIQNVPRKGGMRECYVPREGYIFVDCDYNIAELRSLSQVLINLYGSSEMARIIKEGTDIHKFMAAAIMGISLEEYLERFKTGDKECKEMRQLAKAVDFGAPGGLGARTFTTFARASYGVNIDQERAKELIDLYKSTFPEMAQYFTDLSASEIGGNYTVLQHGSNRLRVCDRFTSAANSSFQGLTADGAKLACWNVARECFTVEDSPLYGCYPVWFIHDQIGLEAPFGQAQEAAGRLAAVMQESMEVFTPDVPCVAEPDMKRRWYKEAEPTFDKDGQLIPWSPPSIWQVIKKTAPDAEESLLDGSEDSWLSEEQLVFLTEQYPQKDPHYWHKANQLWRWEVLARQRNPDPWM